MKKTKKVAKSAEKIPLTADELAWNAHWKKVVEGLEKQRSEVGRMPTVDELAQVAAMMRLPEGEPTPQARAGAAFQVWVACRRELWKQIRDSIDLAHEQWDCGFEPEWSREEWEEEQRKRLKFRNGTERLEAVLKALMPKAREADRYARFRKFLAFRVREQERENKSRKRLSQEAVDKDVEESFVAFKRSGFTKDEYEVAEGMFADWLAKVRSERAAEGAKKRWQKNI